WGIWRRRPGASDRRHSVQLGACARHALGDSRILQSEADGQWPDVFTADYREAGPARQDAGAGDAAGVCDDAERVLRRARRPGGGPARAERAPSDRETSLTSQWRCGDVARGPREEN